MANGNGKANGRRPANGRNGNGNGMSRKQRQSTAARMPRIGVASYGTNSRQLNNEVMCLSGSDFFKRVTVRASPSTVGDRIIEDFPVSPSVLIGTRLAQIATTFERYYFKKFNVRYVPAVPTTLACQLCCYIDTDPLDNPAAAIDADELVRQAVAHTGAQQWNFIAPKVIPLPMRRDRQLYYTGDSVQNERFAYQGNVFVIQVTTPLDISGAPVTSDLECGSLYVDWEVEFQTPQLATDVILPPIRYIMESKQLDLPNAAAEDDLQVMDGFQPGALVLVSLRMLASDLNLGTPIDVSTTLHYLATTSITSGSLSLATASPGAGGGWLLSPGIPLVESSVVMAYADDLGRVTLECQEDYDLDGNSCAFNIVAEYREVGLSRSLTPESAAAIGAVVPVRRR